MATHFENEFIGYKNVVIGVHYIGKGTPFLELNIGSEKKKPSEVTRLDKFKTGSPVYMSHIGDIHSLAYRIKHRDSNKEDDEQDVILGIATPGGQGILLELEFPPCWDFNPDNPTPAPCNPLTLGFVPEDILPVYRASKIGKEDYADQEKGTPDSLIVVGGQECKLVRRRWNEDQVILPKGGRWTKGYWPSKIEIILEKEKIYVSTDNLEKKEDITDSLHKAEVDLPRTFKHFEDYGRWKDSDGIF